MSDARLTTKGKFWDMFDRETKGVGNKLICANCGKTAVCLFGKWCFDCVDRVHGEGKDQMKKDVLKVLNEGCAQCGKNFQDDSSCDLCRVPSMRTSVKAL